MQKAEKAFWAWHCLRYNQTDARMAVKHLFSHVLAGGGHKRSHMGGHQQSTDLAYLQAWDAERAADSKGAKEGWWSKGFSLSSYSVEQILPVHYTEMERGEKSPPNISMQSLAAFSHKSANSHRQTQVWVRLQLISVQVIILCPGFSKCNYSLWHSIQKWSP